MRLRAARAWIVRAWSIVSGSRSDRQFADELESHIELATSDNVRAGLAPEEARRRAVLALGGVEAIKAQYRDRRGLPLVESLLGDVRYGLRMLRRSPGLTAAVALTLAFGIGANAAIFSFVESILLESLPVRSPGELVTMTIREPRSGLRNSSSYPLYRDLRDRHDIFSGVIARGSVPINVSYRGATEFARGELVSGNYFDVLGVRPWIGRLLTPDDDRALAGHPVVVLNYAFWQRRFGADPDIIGKTILLNEYPMTVVGVTDPRFYGLDLSSRPDITMPLMETPIFNPLPPNRLESRQHQWLTLMARRRPGMSLSETQAAARLVFQQIVEREAAEMPSTAGEFARKQRANSVLELSPGFQGRQSMQRELRTPLVLLFAVTAAVLVILVANLMNLLLARSSARQAEIAMRLALGAGRGRVVQQWIVETLLLSVLGAAGAALVALWVRQVLLGLMPGSIRVNIDGAAPWTMFGFLLAVSVISGAVLGAIPALVAVRSDIAVTLKREQGTLAGRSVLSLRGGLVALQVALSVPLLVAAGLFLRSLEAVRHIDTGFTRENVLLASVNPSLNGYTTERERLLYAALLDQVRALPGVGGAALASVSPISGSWDQETVRVEGYAPKEGEDMSPDAAVVSPDFFRALGIGLVAGRDFTDRDTAVSPKVAVINEAMARYFFGSASPIGRHIGLDDALDTEIVGVVRDAKYVDLREPARRHFYVPLAQQARLFGLVLHVRTASDPEPIIGQLRRILGALDPDLPLYDIRTLDQQIDNSLLRERLLSWLSSAFGLLATLMAAIGLYGVVAFSVSRRVHEIGLRIALGARRRDVLALVIRQMLVWVAAGLVIGIGAAVACGQVVSSILYGVHAGDAPTYAVALAAVIGSALMASYLPARRATRIDPLTALRHE